MIRLLFSVGDGGQTAKTFHSIDLPDEKAKLLLQSTAVVIGFENCGIGVHGNEKFQEFLAGFLRRNPPGGVSATWTDDGGIVIPKEIADKVVSSFQQLEPEIACSDPSKAPVDERRSFTTKKHPGYFVLENEALEASYVAKETVPVVGENGEIVGRRCKQTDCLNEQDILEQHLREAVKESVQRANQKEMPGVLYGQGLGSKLWLLLRPSGEFVKSTTEEGGVSYIACTSLEEAQKVAEQQKIYDIDCVPHRVF